MAGRTAHDADTFPTMNAAIEGQNQEEATKTLTKTNNDPEHLSISMSVNSSSIPFTLTLPAQEPAKHYVPQQPTPEMLAQLGIKMRDFAYESTLPPIAPVLRVPRQTQPGPRPLKRVRREWDDGEDDESSGQSRRPDVGGRRSPSAERGTGGKKSKSLERKATEPIENVQIFSRRTFGFADLSQYQSRVTRPPSIALAPTAPARSFSSSPPTSPLQSPFRGESQESEMVVTPLPSPGGSPRWNVTDNSLIPASQLDTESQAYYPEVVSYSQLGLSPQPLQAVTLDISPAISPAPVSPPHPSSSSNPGDPLTDSSPLAAQSSNSPSRPGSANRSRGPPISSPNTTPPRYLLRRRSLLSSHTPTRSRYPHPHPHPYATAKSPSSPKKKGSPKASSRPRRIRNGLQDPIITR
ncbi:hypothetical protein BV22DRAFT_1191042 [Leucogyrophana mollusca]|uniref:Uncharacterized protein n=1 Tax=Leucogyrophana mollusca TaxID=85980 RepID=A0ACB8BXG6_9AGAM|nr:hypothetical protein BV22DRAFT_1191042 [Leucogyrophana mollusca]